jgi:surface protein
MRNILEAVECNGDLGQWNTSNVMDMSMMFETTAKFNADIGSWDTSRVTTMEQMFRNIDVSMLILVDEIHPMFKL